MSDLPSAAREILERGVLCYLAAPSAAGPHVTPVVFVLERGRIWGTTGRGTTKAKLWRREPVAGGLVRAGDRALAFRGPVTMYDLLDPSTWVSSLLRSPELTLASARFTAKNARFFAGYARDAARVPLSWTPPARVLFSVDVASGSVVEGSDVTERWGTWGSGVRGLKSFRAASGRVDVGDLPEEVRGLLDEPRDGVLSIPHPDGPVVLPARAVGSDGAAFARLPRSVLELAGARSSGPASLVADHASAWRAAGMRGLLLRGPSSVYLPADLRAGGSLLASLAGEPADHAVVRIRPRTAVWWLGWSSGTVTAP